LGTTKRGQAGNPWTGEFNAREKHLVLIPLQNRQKNVNAKRLEDVHANGLVTLVSAIAMKAQRALAMERLDLVTATCGQIGKP
jgi:hypothetical protein